MSVKFTIDQFAYSLFSAAEKKNKTEEIEKSLGQLVQLYKKSPEFRFVLLSKRISKSQKSEILMKSLDEKISSISIEILNVLLENDRVGELTLLMRSYQLIGLEFTESKEFADNAYRFQGLDWQASIDRFHIPSVGVRSDLMELAQGLSK